MSNSQHNLEQLQRWLQAVITHAGGVEEGVASEEAHSEIKVGMGNLHDVVLPSRRRSSLQRLAVYGNAYYVRLLECLRELFPMLVQTLGEDMFDRFAAGYLQAYPPGSYTLARLADHFVNYLEETRPQQPAGEAAGEGSNWADFIIDLARLEWHIDQVFDGPGSESLTPLSPDELSRIDPQQWPRCRLVAAPCLRLLSFSYPVNDFFSSIREGRNPAPPAAQQNYLALTRRNFVVRRCPLADDEYALLSHLVSGSAVGEAISDASRQAADLDHFAAALESWFRRWTAEGFFVSVQLPAAGP